MENNQYLLKVKIVGIEPEVYRRFTVPANITLDRLHDVIQIVMGWKDNHSFQFIINDKKYTQRPTVDDDGLECGIIRLSDLTRKCNEFHYLYCITLGHFAKLKSNKAPWDHIITIEDRQYSNPDIRDETDKLFQWSPVQCLDGARACPPEGLDDPEEYYAFCSLINDITEPQHAEAVRWYKKQPWYSGDFDCEAFNVQNVNLELCQYLLWSRDRYIPWGFGEPFTKPVMLDEMCSEGDATEPDLDDESADPDEAHLNALMNELETESE